MVSMESRIRDVTQEAKKIHDALLEKQKLEKKLRGIQAEIGACDIIISSAGDQIHKDLSDRKKMFDVFISITETASCNVIFKLGASQIEVAFYNMNSRGDFVYATTLKL